ncbi:hypothetical protein B0H13DRAFT_1927631 [Mycena leptocephala]|nr:hypothetical protein B0H13DRAFT_1927631 [Mycena leptocephala]
MRTSSPQLTASVLPLAAARISSPPVRQHGANSRQFRTSLLKTPTFVAVFLLMYNEKACFPQPYTASAISEHRRNFSKRSSDLIGVLLIYSTLEMGDGKFVSSPILCAAHLHQTADSAILLDGYRDHNHRQSSVGDEYGPM